MSQSFLAKLPLSRYEIDRDHLTRERPGLFEQLWADPATRVLPVFKGSALLAADGTLALLRPDALPDGIGLRLYLGRSTSPTAPEPIGTPIVAVDLDDAGHLAEGDWADLRSVGHRLSNRDAGMLTEALAMLNWHAAHQFSPRTGAPTVSAKGGWVRRDPVADTEHFPRTDSAVIVGITDQDDRLLLGSNALWESNRYSLLAGFVEPGESLESAVIREAFEESGLRVIEPVYLGSQPWPFPASLMLGFTATVDPASGSLATPDGTEILDLRWFSREELRAALGEDAASARIKLPGPTSIARAIIEQWYGAVLHDGQR
jgi:NAD+ diphosphatase